MTSIVDIGKYYLVEGDILFNKDDLEKANLELLIKTNARIAQYNTYSLVYFNKQSHISFRQDSEMTTTFGHPDDWTAAITDAIAEINYIPNCQLNLNYTTAGTADITFAPDQGTLPDNYLAVAEFPMNWKSGMANFS